MIARSKFYEETSPNMKPDWSFCHTLHRIHYSGKYFCGLFQSLIEGTMQGSDEGDSQEEMIAEDQLVLIFIEYPNNRSCMKTPSLMGSSLIIVIMISSIIVMTVPYSTSVRADNINPGVYSKDAAPYGPLMVNG